MSGLSRGIGAVAAFAALALPGSALAEVTSYHPAENGRSFVTGPGGWGHTTSSEGVCIEQLTCPTVTNSWLASGGTRGGADGHLRTAIENVAGAESVSRATWTSSAFRYRGVDGDAPDEVTFEVARRVDLTALLANTGTSATYTVEMVDAGSGVARTLIDSAPLGSVEGGWMRTRRIDVKPSSLEVGSRYLIRITSTFSTAARVFRESYVDYDDVLLRAVKDRSGGGGSGGGGSAGGGGNGGGGGGGAELNGNRLFLKLECLGIAKKGRCKVRAVAYSRKNGARMTFPIERRVKAKKGKKVTLRVRPRFVNDLAKRKKVLVRSQIKAGDERKTKFRRYKLTEAR